MLDADKPPNNCTTMIARKLTKEEIALRSNMKPRPVETAHSRYMRAIHNSHMLGILEWGDPDYLRISDENDRLDAECKRGESHLYGRARWNQIAQNLDLPYAKVARQLRK